MVIVLTFCAVATQAVLVTKFEWAKVSSPMQLKFFRWYVCALTFGGMGNSIYRSFGSPDVVSPEDQIAMHSAAQGRISVSWALYLAFPSVATPGGLDVNDAKKMSFFLLGLYGLLVAKVFVNVERRCDSETEEWSSDIESCTALRNYFYVDFIAHFIMCFGTASSSCIAGAEIAQKFIAHLQAGREADSVLNHTIKNSVAGAIALLEIEQSGNTSLHDTTNIDLALKQLFSAVQWCVSRQVIIDLTAGFYQTSLSPVNLDDFLREVCSALGTCPFSIQNRAPHYLIAFDEKMGKLALDNALTNARAHGDGGQVIVGVSIVTRDDPVGCQVVFTVENGVAEGSSVGAEALAYLKQKAIRGAQRDYASNDVSSAQVVALKKSSLSTNSGLRHIHLASKGCFGSFDLSPGDSGSSVVLTITMPCRRLDPTPLQEANVPKSSPAVDNPVMVREEASGGSTSILHGLTIYALDDSPVCTALCACTPSKYQDLCSLVCIFVFVVARLSAKVTLDFCSQR